ncbi:class I SAM-dependent methyltransferase [Sinorhizobium numidicum]|uniref:Class I SAM-dependent methyltransferase n=1 Tax=Sinorhizobium numidicum TaxID=680248 RepID=A0ABY8CSE1_9HYPH|nr:class I SAM-dependent methyltransferase [Sinorhizobium numidicum]WEX75088.1 class I SAM-dependent methyltransferase [Sinorhizobium numidicum]WEX81082.1 class I SAM-dependent methyltransferase [Sinorhizobium numidicum]
MSQDFDSGAYWEHRYQKRRDSGDGSYGRLAVYKADFINDFVAAHQIFSVIEFGCGDGAQLDLARYPQYIGLDIAPAAVEACQRSFAEDYTKCFICYDLLNGLPPQELALSLDVIFHLVEDNIFEKYIRDLFAWATRYVIIYSSNEDDPSPAPHVRHRKFTRWIEQNVAGWRLIEREVNHYPHDMMRPQDTSFADFYIYEKEHRM